MKYLTLTLLIFLMALFIVSNVDAKDNGIDKHQYIEVIVQEGDTLWSVAKPYHDGDSDFRKFIYEIRELNNLNQAIIFPGQVLKIPVASQS